MSLTIDEYMQKTRVLIERGEVGTSIEPTSAILWYAAQSSMTSGGFAFMPDFGMLVCWVRQQIVESEFDPESSPRWKYTQEQLDERRADAERRLDTLLKRFVASGYMPEMGQELLQIGGDDFHEYALDDVYVLPGDLPKVLDQVGNPLVDPDLEEDDETAANVPPFDLNNPEHRARLTERLEEAGQ